MKKLRIFLAVLISAVSVANILVARASNPGDDDYEEYIRRAPRYSEPAYQTGKSRKDFFNGMTPESTPKPVPTSKVFSYCLGITTEQSQSERFWRACDEYRKSTSGRDTFRLDFDTIKLHLLPLLENYFEYHYHLIEKDEVKKALNYESFRKNGRPIDYVNYLKVTFMRLNQQGYSHTTSMFLSFQSDRYYRVISCILEDLPQLPLCPPMLRDCCRCMDEISSQLRSGSYWWL